MANKHQNLSPLQRFEEKYFVEKKGGCWIWTAAGQHGYGSFWISGSKIERAHRASWMLYRGKIPRGKHILHSCDNKACVNPDHLEIGSHLKNMRDAWARGLLKPKSHPKKLSARIIKIIRSDPRLQREISVQYGIAQTTVSRIKLRQAWSHIR